MEIARPLRFTKNVPAHLWGDAIPIVAYLENRMPSHTLNLKYLYQYNVSVIDLTPRIFGCTCFVHNHDKLKSEFDPKSIKSLLAMQTIKKVINATIHQQESFC